MKYRKKQVEEIEAITFDELVEHGRKECGPHIHNNMPWSFNYKDVPITHENDTCYLICTFNKTLHLHINDVLITDPEQQWYILSKKVFDETYEKDEFGRATFLGFCAGYHNQDEVLE